MFEYLDECILKMNMFEFISFIFTIAGVMALVLYTIYSYFSIDYLILLFLGLILGTLIKGLVVLFKILFKRF